MGDGPGAGQWLALGGAVLVILGLTFALGLLVGRQWARQTASAVVPSVSEAARKAATTPRRGGIAAEVMADRAPESTEKLTFYQTLTEPLNGPGSAPRSEAKPAAIKASAPGAAVPAAPAPTPISLPPLATKTAPDGKIANGKTADGRTAEGKTADGGSAGAISGPPQMSNNATSPWTIQVGAYKSRRQAEDTRRQLAASGLDAYVASVAARDGQARFRVRVGTYRTREDAATAAEQIRAQRSLTTFVTPK
ncbi:MAG TPA: SPOR domain-containing protein [Methylomirabilota bacterium]